MACALTSHLVSGTPELQFAIDELPTSECVATVVHVVQSEPSAADRGLEVLAAASALRLLHAVEQLSRWRGVERVANFDSTQVLKSSKRMIPSRAII